MDKRQISPLAWKGYFERFTVPILARDRFFIALVVALAVAGTEAAAITVLLPLRRREPYIVEVNSQGRVVSSGTLAHAVGQPTTAQLTYWLGRWVRDLYVVDPSYSQRNLREAYLLTHGPAVEQMGRYLQSKASPLARLNAHASLRVTVTIKTVRRIGPHEAYVVARLNNQLTDQRNEKGVTVSYRLQAPNTVKAALANPIGLQVTNFSTGGGPGA